MMRRACVALPVRFSARWTSTAKPVPESVIAELKGSLDKPLSSTGQTTVQKKARCSSPLTETINAVRNLRKTGNGRLEVLSHFCAITKLGDAKKAMAKMRTMHVRPLPDEVCHVLRLLLRNVKTLTHQDQNVANTLLHPKAEMNPRTVMSVLKNLPNQAAVLEWGIKSDLKMCTWALIYLIHAQELWASDTLLDTLLSNGFGCVYAISLMMEAAHKASDFASVVKHYQALPHATEPTLGILIRSCEKQLAVSPENIREQFKHIVERAVQQGNGSSFLLKQQDHFLQTLKRLKEGQEAEVCT